MGMIYTYGSVLDEVKALVLILLLKDESYSTQFDNYTSTKYLKLQENMQKGVSPTSSSLTSAGSSLKFSSSSLTLASSGRARARLDFHLASRLISARTLCTVPKSASLHYKN